MPASVEEFVIVPSRMGMGAVAVRLQRSDVERLENAPDAARAIYRRATLTAAPPRPPAGDLAPGLFPRAGWNLEPYMASSLFDPDNPFRADIGLRLRGEYEPLPGLVLSGAIRKKVAGNLDTVTRNSNSVLPHVRSDFNLYDKQGDPAIEHATAEYFFRLAPDLYGRISAGYLERMYGGLSTELLWKPVDSRLALGLELNAVRQRDFDQMLGFRAYGVVTGHASAYWDIGNGFFAQVDVGRYLAGDYGATFTLDRVFDNGWKVGAFFTLTNVSFTDFGEGSFDKGLRFTIPVSWLTGRDSPKVLSSVMRPLTRDGGARLELRNRLYGLLEDYQGDRLKRRWGRFWR